MTVLFFSLILWLIGLLDGTHPVMFCSGLLVAWVYLRFYQRHPNGSKGDSAESFSFSSFFPSIVQPVINILVNPIYHFSLRLGIIRPISATRSNSSSLTSVSVTMPGIDPHDMERRRQIALKALSERLSRTTDSSRQNTLPKSFPKQGPSSKMPSIAIPASTTNPKNLESKNNKQSTIVTSTDIESSSKLIDIESNINSN